MGDSGFQSVSVKREACDDIQDEGPAKRPRSGGRAVNVRFLVQSKNAGAIIGKGGSNINRLRTEYKASVTVPDCPGPERILAVVADAETLGDILLDIIPKLDDYAHNQTMDFDCELRMLLHQSHAGCLIGKGGSRIKELREKTGSQIKIFSSCCPNSTERIVQINGVPNVVVNCVKEVCSLISQAPIKGPNKQYDPHHFNPMFASDYGGYEENMQKGRGGRGSFRGRPSGGRGRGGRGGGGGGGGRVWSDDSDFGFGGHDGGQGGYGGSPFGGRGQGLMGQVPGMGNRWNQGGGGPSGGGVESRWAEDTDTGFGGPARNRMLGNMNGSGSGGFMGPGGMGDSQMGGPRAGMMSNAGMGGGFQGGPGMNGPGGNRFMGPRSSGFSPPVPGTGELFSSKPVGGPNGSTCRMKIPNDVAGAIIGKGGQRIRKIRRDSAATINIEEATQGSNDRIITITGAMNQVQMAQYLMQQSVRENQGGRRF